MRERKRQNISLWLSPLGNNIAIVRVWSIIAAVTDNILSGKPMMRVKGIVIPSKDASVCHRMLDMLRLRRGGGTGTGDGGKRSEGKKCSLLHPVVVMALHKNVFHSPSVLGSIPQTPARPLHVLPR